MTGGEPFLRRDLGEIVSIIRSNLGSDVPIRILTNGSRITTPQAGDEAVRETAARLEAFGVVQKSVEVHMSADEYHADLFSDAIATAGNGQGRGGGEEARLDNLRLAARTFLSACSLLAEQSGRGFLGGKLKVHVASDRLAFHRARLFDWMDEEQWRRYVVASEGLIRSGAAARLEGSIPLGPSDNVSLFLFPGAIFTEDPVTPQAQAYSIPGTSRRMWLDATRGPVSGAFILGWWNVIDRVFCGGAIDDAMPLIGR